MRRLIFLLAVVIFSGSCAPSQSAAYGSDTLGGVRPYDPNKDVTLKASSLKIFEDPKAFEHQQVTVCGIMKFEFEDMNIWYSKEAEYENELGLGIEADYKSVALNNSSGEFVCLQGDIEFSGCNSTNICTHSVFDYEIKVED